MNQMNLDELTYYIRLVFAMGQNRGAGDELEMNLQTECQVHRSSYKFMNCDLEAEMKKLIEWQISEDWLFEVVLGGKKHMFGFLIAPAAIHFRCFKLRLVLMNEGYLYLNDEVIKLRWRLKNNER